MKKRLFTLFALLALTSLHAQDFEDDDLFEPMDEMTSYEEMEEKFSEFLSSDNQELFFEDFTPAQRQEAMSLADGDGSFESRLTPNEAVEEVARDSGILSPESEETILLPY